MAETPPRRPMVEAERYTPELLQRFLVDLEITGHSRDVWALLTALGRALDLPFIDFICASSLADFRRTLFIRTSYDSTWLNDFNTDPDIHRWSCFRSHAMHHLTPIMVGLEFVDEYIHIPARRVEVLREAARRGLRAGFSIPLRLHAPARDVGHRQGPWLDHDRRRHGRASALHDAFLGRVSRTQPDLGQAA